MRLNSPVFLAAERPFFSKNRNRRNSSPQAANGLVLFAVSHTCGKNAQRRCVLAGRLVVAYVRASAAALKAFHSGRAMEPSAHGGNAFSATNKPTPVRSGRHVKISSVSAASRTQLHLDKLSGTPVPSISAQVIKANSRISSPKQLVFEGTVNINPIAFVLDGGADRSIMPRAFALTNGITMHLLDPPIATTFANHSSEVIRFATEPLQLQCRGHRSLVQPLVSNHFSFELLVGLDWLQMNNQRVDWDHGSLMLSDSDHCDFPDIQKEPTTLPPPRNHQHATPLYPDAGPTQLDRFPLPLIDVLIDKISKSKASSRLDVRNGFYQIWISNMYKSIWMTLLFTPSH
ncbi:hypothetical protein Efla_003584 [Eimeria flavescens]